MGRGAAHLLIMTCVFRPRSPRGRNDTGEVDCSEALEVVFPILFSWSWLEPELASWMLAGGHSIGRIVRIE
jgi:hypothetical protein